MAQELARHLTPSLTVGRYTHARLHDVRRAVNLLPTAERAVDEPQLLRATGTMTYQCNPELRSIWRSSQGETVAFRASASEAMQNAIC